MGNSFTTFDQNTLNIMRKFCAKFDQNILSSLISVAFTQ